MPNITEMLNDKHIYPALLTAAGDMVDGDVKKWDWGRTEGVRAELQIIRERINKYITQLDEYITDESDDWKAQWDLALELNEPFLQDYCPDEIDIEELTEEFIGKGLNEALAAKLAMTIKYPTQD